MKKTKTGGKNGADGTILKNYVAIILDESGSMHSMRREAMDAFNQQVKDIQEKAKDQNTLVSLVKFNTVVPDPVFWVEPVDRLRSLKADDYVPDGMTAMLDAVGLTIDRLQRLPDAEDENTSFLLLIISDGMENNSKRYSYDDVAERIQRLDKTERWTFTYLGANQDLSHVSESLKIPMANVNQFVADSAGMVEGSLQMRFSSERFFTKRREGHKHVRDFYKPDDAPEPSEPDQDGSSWKK